MRIKPRFFLILLCCCVLPQHLQAGAWTQEKGKKQLITTASFYQTERFFDSGGNKQSQPKYQKIEINSYMEYGLGDLLTLGGSWSTIRVQQDSTTMGRGVQVNLGDTELFARKRIWKDDKKVFSLQPSITIPSPDKKDVFPKVGSDHFSFAMTANYGHNFTLFSRNHYADMAAGYVHRLGEATDQVKLDATVGFSITNTWTFTPQLFMTHSRKAESNAPIRLSPGDNYDLAELQLSVSYKLNERADIRLGGFAPIKGKNTGAGQGVLLGFGMQF